MVCQWGTGKGRKQKHSRYYDIESVSQNCLLSDAIVLAPIWIVETEIIVWIKGGETRKREKRIGNEKKNYYIWCPRSETAGLTTLSRSDDQKRYLKTVAMINLDSVGVGDHFNVYAGKDNNPGWVRELTLKIGRGIGHDSNTSSGSQDLLDCDCDFAWGETADWSDHKHFRLLGIPIAYFEMMNWELDTCEGVETVIPVTIENTCRPYRCRGFP
jgi:hypothetical protein